MTERESKNLKIVMMGGTSKTTKSSKHLTKTTSTDAKTSKHAQGGAKDDSCAKNDKKRVWNEIDSLFDDGKKRKTQQEATAILVKQQKIQKRIHKHQTVPKASQDAQKWLDDGLGGVYNTEGFTGRVEDGVKVFKAHLLRKPNAGESPDCPFDCSCCFI
jgi:hypothetical protein